MKVFFLRKRMSEMLPYEFKSFSKQLNYEERLYSNTIRNRKQHCFRRFFPYIALFQIHYVNYTF